jgi:hydroxymethylpyrimidine pyrophosphatase-like HAD family hydrolase
LSPATSGVRVVYSDLDGTMVGPGGCFFRREDRSITLDPARVLADLLAADVALVLVSGRTEAQLHEACGIFGADGYVAELGALVGWNLPPNSHGHPRPRGRHVLRGAMPGEYDVIPPALVTALTEQYAGYLELHDPWAGLHEFDVMLRGHVDAPEADAWLAEQGAGWLRLYDNGRISPRETGLRVTDLHVYHLVPDGVDKGAAVAWDLARRGLAPEQAIAIGDSASDLAMATQVGRFHLVENGARTPAVRARAEALGNVVIEDGALGAGWASAIQAALGDKN